MATISKKNILSTLFSKSRNSQRKSDLITADARAHFYENYHNIHKFKIKNSESTPSLALLKTIEKEKLQREQDISSHNRILPHRPFSTNWKNSK